MEKLRQESKEAGKQGRAKAVTLPASGDLGMKLFSVRRTAREFGEEGNLLDIVGEGEV
jgi:hypothetical protein